MLTVYHLMQPTGEQQLWYDFGGILKCAAEAHETMRPPVTEPGPAKPAQSKPTAATWSSRACKPPGASERPRPLR